MQIYKAIIVIASSICVFTCAKFDPKFQWQKVESITKERSEGPIIWERPEGDTKSIQTQIDNLIADGLTRQEAVRIALLNNRKLQASFEEIGIAQGLI